MAMGALHALHKAGLQVPDDCSVSGFDNIPLSQFTSPPLTTFHQPRYELGIEAAEMMLRLLERKERNVDAAEMVTLRGEMMIRESTAPPASGTGLGEPSIL